MRYKVSYIAPRIGRQSVEVSANDASEAVLAVLATVPAARCFTPSLCVTRSDWETFVRGWQRRAVKRGAGEIAPAALAIAGEWYRAATLAAQFAPRGAPPSDREVQAWARAAIWYARAVRRVRRKRQAEATP